MLRPRARSHLRQAKGRQMVPEAAIKVTVGKAVLFPELWRLVHLLDESQKSMPINSGFASLSSVYFCSFQKKYPKMFPV